MDDARKQIDDEAAGWVLRTRSDDFVDWSALADWMARSSEHARTFNCLSALDAELGKAMPSHSSTFFAQADNDDLGSASAVNRPRGLRRRWALGAGAVAACIAGALVMVPARTALVYHTPPGAKLEVALGDGVKAVLNGATRLEVSAADGRTVSVVRGEATFSVVQGSGRPMRVAIGDVQLRDIGTVFNVVRTPSLTQVGVSDGQVEFDGPGDSVVVKRGQAVRLEAGRSRPEIFAVPLEAVAGWQSGRLFFRDAGMTEIAGALSRKLGLPVAIGKNLEGRRFTGVLNVTGERSQVAASVEPMLGVRVVVANSGWTLDAISGR